MSSLDECVVIFNWETVYACSQFASSTNWTVENPVTGQTYNLTQLKPILSATSSDRKYGGCVLVSFKLILRYNFTVGLAGWSVPCGTSSNVSICQTSVSDHRTFVLARATNFSLTVTGGKVFMKMCCSLYYCCFVLGTSGI